MSYLVFARKYRPQTFDEIVGQEAVSKTLKNSIEAKRLHHAYMFFGPRGCGKTTSARVMAKALNCAKGPAPEPCGKCDSCKEITEGRALDVLEIDAATHTQVDKVREVIVETVAFAPSRDRYKIFIIDEAHMLSTASFNALLKTLEEPPAHVIFMLATTEPQKIPATIFSRCQRHRFRLVPPAQVAAHLASLVKKEKLKAEPEALELLARAGGGSVRDSLSLLDQAVSFQDGALTLAGISDLLGLLPGDAVHRCFEAVFKKDAPALWSCLEAMSEGGYEPAQLLKDLRDRLEAMYLDRLGARPMDDAALKALAAQQPPEAVGRLLRKVQRGLEELRWSDSPRIALELTMFGLIEEAFDLREWVTRLENLEKRASTGAPAPMVGAPGRVLPSSPAPSYSPAPRPAASAPQAPAPRAPEAPKAPAPAPSTEGHGPAMPEAAEPTGSWAKALARVRVEKPVLAGYLEEAQATLSGKTVTVAFRKPFHKTGAERQTAYLKTLFSELEGRDLEVKLVVDGSLQPPSVVLDPGIPADSPDNLPWKDVNAGGENAGLVEDSGVKKVLDVFPGKVRKPKQP